MAKLNLLTIVRYDPGALVYHQLFSKLPMEPTNTHLWKFLEHYPYWYSFPRTRLCFVK